MMTDTYRATRDERTGVAKSCVDLVESPDDDGWYAQEYNFLRRDNATRTSSRIYRSREALVRALDDGTHRWTKWD
jgi:hypothetical protein